MKVYLTEKLELVIVAEKTVEQIALNLWADYFARQDYSAKLVISNEDYEQGKDGSGARLFP